MKTFRNITCIALLSLTLQSNFIDAQIDTNKDKEPVGNANYKNNAIGLRAGETSGLTFKHFFNSTTAFEGILSASPFTFGITALYEKYAATGVTGLRWYYGAGAHVTSVFTYGTYYYTYYPDRRYYAYRYNYPGLGIGIDGIFGLEYQIPKIPLALSLDMKPFVEINNAPNVFFALDPGFGIKFTF